MGEISEALRRARESSSLGESRLAPHGEAAPLGAVPPRDRGTVIEIPGDATGDWAARSIVVAPRSEVAEAYRQFALRVQRLMRERGSRSLIVTSAARGEGKTTTSCNLALALASMASGRRIALLDLDIRRPAAAYALGVKPEIGIEQALTGASSLASCCIHTQLAELDLYLAAGPARDPLSVISSPRTAKAIQELSRQYDTLVIDSPPVLPVPDVSLLCAQADSILLVARSGVSRTEAVREAYESFPKELALGVFLNELATPRHRRYRGYYAYDASERDGKKEAADAR